MSYPNVIDRNFQLDEPGAMVVSRVTTPRASAQLFLVEGSIGAAVVEVVVSNDGSRFVAHPDVIEISASGVTEAFTIAPYSWYGVRVKTKNATAAVAEIYLRGQGR